MPAAALLANPAEIELELAAICGTQHAHQRPEPGPAVRVAPASTAECAAVLQLCDQRGWTVTPTGSGTKLDWLDDAAHGSPNVLLDTTRLNRVLEHTWQDMTATVQAGCRWADFQNHLAQHGQFVALDPLWPARATVGGIVSANDSGALRLRYGGLRDLLIGMTVVLPDGTVARSGGKVVKNVAGYDLPKLLCGAFGTLALITELTFRLHSLPRHTRTFWIADTQPEPLAAMLLTLLNSHLNPQSLQLRSTASGFSLDVRLAGLSEVLETQAAALQTLAAGSGLNVSEAARSESAGDHADGDIWSTRESLFNDPAATILKATMLPTQLGAFCRRISELGGSLCAQATGIAYAALPPDTSLETLATMRAALAAAGGSLTLLRAPEDLDLDRWGNVPALPLMRELKRRFDPDSTLNPGRFLRLGTGTNDLRSDSHPGAPSLSAERPPDPEHREGEGSPHSGRIGTTSRGDQP